ncbi:hypothetical protein [Methylophaga nitratireducenticrescens]|uniref:hypothetical protein n=1 Tax=Methylophaga nitratireducenticrescens TaxID=754476 RepID=UPI000CDC8C55|nr:hypothetical protein [Methylophaga nitratireducenticrescens]AUZ86159.1 hypothetical protein CDW43_16015 [Methylophaga nitratireducenticrescens]
MKMKKIPLSSLFIAMAVTGCSGDAANEANFKEVLQAYYDSQVEPATCIAAGLKFPYEEKKTMDWNIGGTSIEDKLAALADAGLIEKAGNNYNLSKTGEEYHDDSKGFCYGRIQVTQVTNFTEPNTMQGYTVSRVNYDLSVSDRPQWSENGKITETYNLTKAGLRGGYGNTEPKHAMMLIKTNKGWITEKEM